MEEVLTSLEHRVTECMNTELIKPFNTDEIQQALNQMHPLKSSRPDGMSAIFYQKFWIIVGTDVSACILEFLNGGNFNSLINDTQIVLIPKCPNPSDMSQFRPISLCNVLYKLASKVLANRLKPFLDSLILPSQSAFVLGHLITDNVLIAYKLNHFLLRKHYGNVGHVSLKLDISKAYDRVEWCFLERVLYSHGGGTLCVKNILSLYEKASGLVINSGKSAMVFGKNMDATMQLTFANILGVAVVPRHEKYLGLPTVVGRSKKEVFAGIKERIWKKLQNWTSNQLSQAGGAVLLKTEQGDLGFRRIKEVNLALLAKQAWRMAMSPDSLLHGGQRAINSSDELAVAPSAKDLSTSGTTFFFSGDARVVDLTTASNEWQSDLILAKFHPVDAECILGIDLHGGTEQDKLVWHYEHRRNFSVRSAYAVARMLNSEEGGSSAPQQRKFLWN
ncbi:UNVERIFIED_CONTAM: hypothetical protein Slati_4231300 [Sesamum latifolium]|uniref:Reverse transcriptase domain-containing protein n=1 Tax=Sesamum latifolium TaxID=2727402 RepID=A0AAW2TB53_9LAMI